MEAGTVFTLAGLIITYNSDYYILVNGYVVILQPERLTQLLAFHKANKPFKSFEDFKVWIENS